MMGHSTCLHHTTESLVGICLEQCQYHQQANHYSNTHHGLDVRMRHGIKLVKVQLEVLLNVDVSALVLGAVAVSGSREDSDATSIMLDLVPVHSDFVTADDGFQAVILAEAFGDVRTEL